MRARVRVPGKLILLGEYCVLQGGAGLVMAVNRYATVTIIPGEKQGILLSAPDIGFSQVYGTLSRNGNVDWESGVEQSVSGRLKLVSGVLAAFREELFNAGQGWNIQIDTGGLMRGGDGQKIGLGSSAAVSVGLYKALGRVLKKPDQGLVKEFKVLREIHSEGQGARGSGLDIVASLSGGLTHLTAGARSIEKIPKDHLEGLHWCAVYTGRAASTPDLLRGFNRYCKRETMDANKRILELGEISRHGISALKEKNHSAFLDALNAYGQGLDDLGRIAEVSIVEADHRRISSIAEDCNVVYKVSGAGGGDLGFGICRAKGDLDEFKEVVDTAGYFVPNLEVALV